MNPPSEKQEIQALLRQMVEGTGAWGAIAWNCQSLPFQEVEAVFADDSIAVDLPLSPDQHLELLEDVATKGKARIIAGRNHGSSTGEMEEHRIPVLVLVPGAFNGFSQLVIEAFLPPDQNPATCQLAVDSITQRLTPSGESGSPRQATTARSPGQTYDGRPAESGGTTISDYCDQIHRSIEKQETAARIANEARRLLACDRVSVVQQVRGQARIQAISGQASVNRRSHTVRLLEQLAKRVLPLKTEFVYPSSESHLAPQVESALHDYLQLSVSRCLAIIPLLEKPREEIAGASGEPAEPRLVGGLIIEHFTEDWDLDSSLPRVRIAAEHAANAYANALRHESLWLYPLWKLLGKSRWLTATRRLPVTLSVGFGILILILAMILIPWEFKVVSDGYLVPEKIEYLYAPFDGEVINVVAEGTVLPLEDNPIPGGNPYSVARLLNLDLSEKISRVEGLLREAEKELYRLNRNLDYDEGSPPPRSEGQIRAQIESLETQRRILQSQADQLVLDASGSGTVLTHNTRERLLHRPFQRGDQLLEIADTAGNWVVELQMPDDRIGHVLNAQDALGPDLKVTCVLATDPGRTFSGRILDVAKSTEVSQEAGQTVTIVVAIDPETDPALLHARAQVVGKVHCGSRSLGYVWFHQVGEFFQKNVWFRIW